jgi:hypothetical protein
MKVKSKKERERKIGERKKSCGKVLHPVEVGDLGMRSQSATKEAQE